MKLRKSLIAVTAITALGVSALAGCSTGGGSDEGIGSASLTIAKPDGAITTESGVSPAGAGGRRPACPGRRRG